MAWYCYGNRICRTGLSDSPNRRRTADRLCHLCIGAGLAEANRLQVRPDAPLKGGGLNVQRKRSYNLEAVHVLHKFFGQISHALIISTANSKRKLVLQRLLKFLVGVRELNRADAFIGCSDQNAT